MTAPLNPNTSAGLAWKRITNGEVLAALRASNATVSKLNVENIGLRREVSELRDALAVAYSLLGQSQQYVAELEQAAQCVALSAQGQP